MTSIHDIAKLCRVCGERLNKATGTAPIYDCSKHRDRILATFGVDVSTDDNTLHPRNFCNRCYAATRAQESATSEGLPYRGSTKVFIWSQHVESECTICEHIETISKGGRRRKQRKNRGRPTGTTPASVIHYVKQLVPPNSTKHDNVTYISDLPQALTCPLCHSALSQPVELQCDTVVCASCCCKWIVSNGLQCPCCSAHQLDENNIQMPPSIVINLLADLKLQCNKCGSITSNRDYPTHSCTVPSTQLHSTEDHNTGSQSPSRLSARDILNRPLSEPTQPIEKLVAERLVRRLMAESSDPIVRVPTRGQPIMFLPVSNKRVSEQEASPQTIRRRIQRMREVRSRIGVNLEEEVRLMTRAKREELLKKVNLPIQIPTEHALAMKTNLSISWNKLRTLRRWLKVFNISLASEGKQRIMANEIVEDNVHMEMVPFSFTGEQGKQYFKEAPFVCVRNIIAKVADNLSQHLQSGGFTWHNGAIPSDEIWVKIAGDKGHGSFKLTMQVVNVATPNSSRNTTLLLVFKAGDSPTNLHIALQQFKQHVQELQGMTWRSWKIRVFLSGDYEFLTTMYGLSGASGRHNCLWCLIRNTDLRIPLDTRGRLPTRSLQSLHDDYQGYITAGNDLKHAKDHNNVIREAIFPIPLENVCIPGLHLSLGIFLRLFNLLEADCNKLDMLLAAENSSTGIGGPTFEQYAATLQELSVLKDQQNIKKNRVNLLSQLVTYLLLTVPAPQQSSTIQQVSQELSLAQQQLTEMSTNITKLESGLNKIFQRQDGPFFQSLDRSLVQLNVERQAYHGGSFVGNHVHKMIQDQSIEVLCSAIVTTAQDHCAALIPKATEVSQKFRTALSLFAKCHKAYNGGVQTDSDVHHLESDIAAFMAFYRRTFPSASVLPKMHILEDHVIPMMQKWHMGSGLLGEQGAESIHAHLNLLEVQFGNIKNPLDKLRYVFKEHNLESAPTLNSLRPQPRKKRKNSREGQGQAEET